MTNGIKKLWMVAALMAVGPTAFADLDLSENKRVQIESRDRAVVIRAYPALDNCKVWQYFPGSLTASGDIDHQVNRVRVKAGTGVGLVNSFSFSADPAISPQDVELLRAKIFEFARSSVDCKALEEKINMKGGAQISDHIRPKTINEVSLVAAEVKIANFRPVHSESSEKSTEIGLDTAESYEYLATARSRSSSDSWDSSIEKPRLTYYNDATEPGAVSRARRKLISSGRSEVGTIGFVLDGVIANMNGSIQIRAEMVAQFFSFMKTECSEVSKKGDGGAMLIGYAAAGIPGAIVGGLMEQKTKSCVEKLVSFFKGGDLSGVFILDLSQIRSKDQDGNPIMVETCNDKGQCGKPIGLETYVKAELVYLFVASGFLRMVNETMDATLRPEDGKSGEIKSKFNLITASKRALRARRTFTVPVYALGLNGRTVQDHYEKDPLIACAQANFDKQIGTESISKLLGVSPLPIHTQCLNGGQ